MTTTTTVSENEEKPTTSKKSGFKLPQLTLPTLSLLSPYRRRLFVQITILSTLWLVLSYQPLLIWALGDHS